jgi:DNA-binding CsgD family transcriptional regulator
MLLGREHEARVIRDLVGSIPERGGALVLVGDPGIGKSALAGLARELASEHGLEVLFATGIPAESRLPFAGLHQLLRPLHDRIGELPEPQRDALLSAFGKGTGEAPSRVMVAMAVTDLVTAAAARQPLLILADDAHWLDRATGDVLTFLARRIDGTPAALLATVRHGYQLPLLEAGLPELRLAGLDEQASGQLLDAVAPGLTAVARREILDTSIGNPLALCELSGSALRTDPAAAGLGALAVTYRIEKAFAARWGELPEQTRTVLVIAALNEGGALSEILQAATLVRGSPVTTEAVIPAVTARLVEACPARLRFRHPLVRSAIEYRAGLSQITAAHQALAAVLAGQPDRRAWHRAGAALGPDENVATELDEAASRADRRAAVSVAITAMDRAVELSTDPPARTSRLLRAAQLSFELGRPALVERYVRSVERAGLDLANRARLALLQESIEADPAGDAERIRYLAGLARETAKSGEAELAMELLVSAARRCWWADPGRDVRLLVAGTALELAPGPLHPPLQSVLAFAAPDVYGGLVRGRLPGLSHDPRLDPVELTHLGVAATVLGAFGQARALLGAAIPGLRQQGRLGLLVRALNHDATSAVYASQWQDAIIASEESNRAAIEAGQYRWVAMSQVSRALAAAMRGEDEVAERLASEAEQVLLPAAIGSAMALVQIARGLAALGRRDYHQAYDHLIRIYDPSGASFNHLLRLYHLGDLADAAAHSGQREQARGLVTELGAMAAQEPGPLLDVSLAFTRAMLADDADARDQFEQALAADLRSWPFHHGRLRLEYGGWLRRHRQPALSRPHLRAAREILDAIGARAWRDRADAELRASGEHRRAAAPQAGRLGQLTPQEQQIARMVLAGLSNREIGERLFVSHRTVAYHLYRMFPKLGITSRAELGAVLAAEATS